MEIKIEPEVILKALEVLQQDRAADNARASIRLEDEIGRRTEEINAQRAREQRAREEHRAREEPIPMLLDCPACHKPHIDEGEYATKPHRTHKCLGCGKEWRSSLVHTVGVKELPF